MAGIVDAHVPPATCYRSYLDNIRFALDTFQPHGVGVLIEPINNIDVPGYFMGDISVARRAVKDLESGGVRVMLDVYHVAMHGRDPAVTLREILRRLSAISRSPTVPGDTSR